MCELSELYPTQHFYPLDVADENSVKLFCEKAYQVTGAPNLLINNAAVINTQAPLWEIPGDEFNELMLINVSGTANMIRHTLPYLLNDEALEKRVIINLSSGWGRSTSPLVTPYCASKWAIEGLNQALSQELPSESGIASISPETWAKIAAPFILNLDHSNNGDSLTVPR